MEVIKVKVDKVARSKGNKPRVETVVTDRKATGRNVRKGRVSSQSNKVKVSNRNKQAKDNNVSKVTGRNARKEINNLSKEANNVTSNNLSRVVNNVRQDRNALSRTGHSRNAHRKVVVSRVVVSKTDRVLTARITGTGIGDNVRRSRILRRKKDNLNHDLLDSIRLHDL